MQWEIILPVVGIGMVAIGFRRALVSGLRHRWETRRRIQAEDALKHVHHCELRGHPATADSLAGAMGLRPRPVVKLITGLEAQGWLRSSAEGLSLTSEGARLAIQVIRAHRLWERYLVDEARMPVAAVHAEAERREHTHTAEQLDALDAAMGHPTTDPHGDPIPTAGGELARQSAMSVIEWPLRTPARIVHLEDEPAAVFAQIAAIGLRPGQVIQVIESDAHRLVLSDGDETHVLAPMVGANISVCALEPEHEVSTTQTRLTTLKPGQRAIVHRLADTLQGFTRRRLLDLGLTPGVTIESAATGVFRDPVAYRVRGSLVALRREQADHVWITLDDGIGARHG